MSLAAILGRVRFGQYLLLRLRHNSTTFLLNKAAPLCARSFVDIGGEEKAGSFGGHVGLVFGKQGGS